MAPRTHAVTFMTPEYEVVIREPTKVPKSKVEHEKVHYGSRAILHTDPSVVFEADSLTLKKPIKESMENVRDILSYIDWKVKLY